MTFTLRPLATYAADAEVRMAFLLNFSRFSTWPKTSLADNAVLNVCIRTQNDNFIRGSRALESQLVKGHSLKIIQVSAVNELADCHVAYLANDLPDAEISNYLTWLQSRNVLSISDTPNFLERGGMIGLEEVGGRYVFDVSLRNIRKTELNLSTSVLKIARSVR
ncbi:YfiR family protein [Methylophilus luteus]|uniref:YfiR family protein n=1 Tax=Methylophilus luteus TaxID=640108 RepID=A0ABW3F8R3_9PROT